MKLLLVNFATLGALLLLLYFLFFPYSKVGGLAILFGNLAEEGCVIKTAGITGSRKFTGKAVCFNSQQEAIDGIVGGKVKEGDVVVIRYEGPKDLNNQHIQKFQIFYLLYILHQLHIHYYHLHQLKYYHKLQIHL
jgi:hypothetical protein